MKSAAKENVAAWLKPALQLLLPAFCAAVYGLALSRVLFEAFFPQAVLLGRPPAALSLALLAGAAGGWLARALDRRLGPLSTLAIFLPLLLNAQAILQPQGPTLLSRLLLAGSLWLALAVAILSLWTARRTLAGLALGTLALRPTYMLTMGRTVGRADTFEFQVVIPKLGIVHPTGYPLYLLLGRLFTFIPFGSVAWRVNLASVVFGLIAACLLFLFIRQLTRRTLPALLAALLFALAPTFWSQAIEAEVYALHAVFVGAVMVGMGKLETGDWRPESRDRRLVIGDWRLRSVNLLTLLYFLIGLGLTNHRTTIILLPAVLLATAFVWVGGRRKKDETSPQTADRGQATSQSPVSGLQSSITYRQSPVSSPQSPISNLQSLLSLLSLLSDRGGYHHLPQAQRGVDAGQQGGDDGHQKCL